MKEAERRTEKDKHRKAILQVTTQTQPQLVTMEFRHYFLSV